MKDSTFHKIARAIDGHCLIVVTDDVGARIIEPYLVFESAAGDMLLHGWQRDGAFKESPPPDWCNLHLDDMLTVKVLAERFGQPRHDYNPRSSNFHRVIYEIDPRRTRPWRTTSGAQRQLPRRRKGPPKRKSRYGKATRVRHRRASS